MAEANQLMAEIIVFTLSFASVRALSITIRSLVHGR